MAEILFKELSFTVVEAALEVHKVHGPGFLEAVYQAALAHGLKLRDIPFIQLIHLPVTY
jgi:GxxExxY protein